MPCYYKEFFGLGMLVAFFIFAIVIMFEDIIKKGIRKLFGWLGV